MKQYKNVRNFRNFFTPKLEKIPSFLLFCLAGDPQRSKNQLANREKLQCQNVDDNDEQPNSNKGSKHDTSEESLTGNADDNEVQPNSTDASKDGTSEESPKGNGKRSSENTFGNFCKTFKF